MSRRQHTTLTFSITLPLPAGMTQKAALAHVLAAVHRMQPPEAGGFATRSAIVKVTDKKITYL